MDLDMKQLAVAIRSIAEEKNLPENIVQQAVEQALAAAYRRDFGDHEQDIRIAMNLNSGDIDAFVSKEVVKIAVTSNISGVDPVGTFVGGHGTRVNAVVSEVGEQEKIDIIVWSEEPKEYIINALSPTKVTEVKVDEAGKKARVIVPEDQLSIAIGKGGQNVRLASKLTEYELDIEAEKVKAEKEEEPVIEEVEKPKPKLKSKNELESSLLEAIEEHGEDGKTPKEK